jgi:hypothetical protein
MRRYFNSGLLLSPDDGNGGGGSDDKNKTETNYVTLEQLNSAINGAAKNITDRVMKKQSDMFTQMTGEDSPLMQSLAEMQKSITQAGYTKKPDGKGENEQSQPGLSPELEERFGGLEKTNKALTEQVKAYQQKDKQREVEAIAQKRSSGLLEFLEKGGFERRAKAVLALHSPDIEWDEDDEAPYITNSQGEKLPYKDWVRNEYAKSDEGKDFLPPSGKFGSGATNKDADSQSSSDTDPDSMTDEEIMSDFDKV